MHIYNNRVVTLQGTNFSLKDIISLGIFIGILIIIGTGVSQMTLPIGAIVNKPISLEPSSLPEYAMRTVIRMFIAIGCSVVFSIIYGTIAAKSKYAEKILIPTLDIIQSIPVLGFISFTVTGFIGMFPGSSMGLELASTFAAFTNQVPNMTFSFYQSLKTVREDLKETCTIFGFSSYQRFFSLELPSALPGLIWNGMMSMSGSWFLIVASEAITVNQQTIMLPGIGSYIAQAIQYHDLAAIGYAIITMLIVIFLYDQLFFRPLVAWGDKFHAETNEYTVTPKSFVLDLFSKTWIFTIIGFVFGKIFKLIRNTFHIIFTPLRSISVTSDKIFKYQRTTTVFPASLNYILKGIAILLAFHGLVLCYLYIKSTIGFSELFLVIKYGFFTMLRVLAMIIIAALVWVPIGVYVGLRPTLAEKIEPIAQFLAAFPANIIFPFAVIFITHYHLNPNIWLSPLMILGTQWYILFNVIAGTASFPKDLIYTSNMLNIKGWLWWRKVILPGIFPYFVTGAITAAGGSWNASIIAEVVSWGNVHYVAEGIGAYITKATTTNDFPRIIIGISIMSLYVIVLNNLIWHPLYNLAEKKSQLE